MKDLTKKQKRVFLIICLTVGVLWLIVSAPDYLEKRKAVAKDKAELQAKLEVEGESPLDRMINTSFDLCSIGEKWIIYDDSTKLMKDHNKKSGHVGAIPKGTIVKVINTYGLWKLCKTEDMLGWIDTSSVKAARKL